MYFVCTYNPCAHLPLVQKLCHLLCLSYSVVNKQETYISVTCIMLTNRKQYKLVCRVICISNPCAHLPLIWKLWHLLCLSYSVVKQAETNTLV